MIHYNKLFKISSLSVLLAFMFVSFSLFSCDDMKEVEEYTKVELKVNKKIVKANGADFLSFDIKDLDNNKVNNAKIYYIYEGSEEPVLLEDKKFLPTKPGKYKFYAVYGNNEKSDTVEIEVKQSVLKLVSDKTKATANGEDKVVFTVYQDDEKLNSDYTIFVSKDNGKNFTKIEKGEFSTTEAGEYLFKAEYKKILADELTVTFDKVNIVLSADKKTLKADNIEFVNLTIESSDEKIKEKIEVFYTLENSDKAIKVEGNKFSTDRPGTYYFYAQFGENIRSEKVAVVFQESVLRITPNKLKVKTYTDDKITFTVSQDGKTLTSEYEILVSKDGGTNYEKLENNEFSTTTVGEYLFIAKYKTLRSESVKVVAESVSLRLLANKKDVLKADNNDAVTFTINCSDEQVKSTAGIYYTYNDNIVPAKLEGNSFRTDKVGRYVFYAKYGNQQRSDDVTVDFQESVLKLTTNTTKIKANGTDRVTFNVTQDDKVVQTGYEIHVSKNNKVSYEKINGTEYAATQAGDYWFIAKYKNFTTQPIKVVVSEVVLKLSADKTSLIANGTNKVVFTLKQDEQAVTDYTLSYQKNNTGAFVEVSSKEYVFTEHGTYTFKAVRQGKTSNTVTVTATQSVLELRPDKNSLTAYNEEQIVFSVLQDNAPISKGYQIRYRKQNESSYKTLESNVFKTNEAGDYVFNVQKGNVTSADVQIKANQKVVKPKITDAKPILVPSVNSISHISKERVTFRVTINGEDVTNQYQVYRLMSSLNSEVEVYSRGFAPSTVGEYVFLAREINGSKVTEKITVSVVDIDVNSPNRTVFVKNVTLNSGWHDVNKKFTPRTPEGVGGDHVLCWAASASNMVQWWLEDYVKKGHELPAGTPLGADADYELKMFKEFTKRWQNYVGDARVGVHFLLVKPDLEYHATNLYLYPEYRRTHKGFFLNDSKAWEKTKDFFSNYGVLKPNPYVKSYSAYSGWMTKQGLKGFTELILRLIDEGAVSLTVGGHEITVWGVKLKNNRVDYLYVTNSDDGIVRLEPLKVTSDGRDVFFDVIIKGSYDKRIVGLVGLKAYDR